MTTIETEVHQQLRVWAAGIYNTEAATTGTKFRPHLRLRAPP